MPKPQTDINQKMDVDGLALSKLQIGQNDPKASEKTSEKTDDDELTKAEKRDQQEGKST